MQKKFKLRFFIALGVICAMFITLILGTASLTLFQGTSLITESESRITRTLSVDGARGTITDASGIPLAYDESSYDVQFLRDPSKSTYTDKAYFTDIIIKAIEIIEQNGGEIIDTFNIVMNDDGSFDYYFGDISEEAKAKRIENWKSNMYVSSKSEPDAIYRDLRNRYRIPEYYTYEQARKLLSVWQEVQLSSYMAYQAVTIAKDVNTKTVALIEARADELEGMQIAASTTRVYPKDSTAAHIIGYLGKMYDDDTIEQMTALGYTQDDSIGITGIESSMENYLTGNTTDRQGSQTVEVSSVGKVISELSSTPATQGDTVMLTIDMQMQMVAEKALEQNINDIYAMQMEEYTADQNRADTDPAKMNYDTALGGREPNLAKSGAAVVMDVKTGDVLAMASYPSYDLNLFSGGIASEDYQALSEDPATPLFNKAISSKGIPGSIFKLCTAIAGLEEGVFDLNTMISDAGYFDKYIVEGSGAHGPACWVEPYFDEHQNLDLINALKVSCNYFFFTVADGLGVDRLDKWAEELGLTAKTNIEIPGEVAGQVGGPTVLYDPSLPVNQQKTALPTIVYNQIVRYLGVIADERGVEYSDDVIDLTANKLIALAANESTKMGADIRNVLYEYMDVPTEVSSKKGYDNNINIWLSELVWNPTETAITGIGAGISALTPIAVARYVSAIVNGGTVYDAHIVDRVLTSEGTLVEEIEPTVYNELNVRSTYLDAIMEGMKQVVSPEDGTQNDYFSDWKYADMIGGKTGTGVVTENVKLEDNAWFVAFAPYDDPEIAVVVYIPNGYKGSNAIPTAKSLIEYYLDRKYEKENNSEPYADTLLPYITAEEQAAQEATADQTAADQPATDQTAEDQAVTDQAATDQAATDQTG